MGLTEDKMCEPASWGLENDSSMTGHHTSEHRLGTQGEAMAATWVHEAEGITRAHHSLVECSRWTFCIWWKEGQGRSPLPLQFTSPAAQLYWGEALSYSSVGPLFILSPAA